MSCFKCHQDKATPVTIAGNDYCIACAAIVIDEANEQEHRESELLAELQCANHELANIDAQVTSLKEQISSLASQEAGLLDERDALSNKIDKLNFEIKKSQEGTL